VVVQKPLMVKNADANRLLGKQHCSPTPARPAFRRTIWRACLMQNLNQILSLQGYCLYLTEGMTDELLPA
jgi:hypothetical protein